FPHPRLQIRALPPDQNPPAARHEIDQQPELLRNGSKVRIDVRMIEFQRRKNQLVGMVVKKLGPAVEERGLVFVALDDELFPTAEAIAAVVEIRNHAAHQKVRPPPGDVKNPSKHRGGSRLTVSSADNDRFVSGNEKILKKLCHRAVRDFLIEDIFQLRIAASDHVADNYKIGRGLKIFLAIAVAPPYSQRIEQGRCRRINADVRASDSIAPLLEHPGNGRHRRAGDTQQVNVLESFSLHARDHHATHAGSRMLRRAADPLPSPVASSSARMPRGRVKIGRCVCPIGAPQTMGISSGSKMRRATSLTVSLPAGPSQSGKSPRTIPASPRNLPDCLRCMSARSTCQGFMPRSSRTRIAPLVSSSHGVPSVVST